MVILPLPHMSSTLPPITVYAEMTPNPASMRYVASRPLLDEGRMLEFRGPSEPEGISPLAQKIFDLPFVTGVSSPATSSP